MTREIRNRPVIAIACGGTGGHLFPGVAVAEELQKSGCAVALLVSPKEVDRQAMKTAPNSFEIVTLPAVGLERGRNIAFVRCFAQSCRAAKKYFKKNPPQAVLAMGGFTSAPPVLAARFSGAKTFLHESNSIPGRANRWLSWIVNQAFIGFPQAAGRLHNRNVVVTGTPVRAQFQLREPAACRAALGMDPARPVVLVVGGSQGAGALNTLVIESLRPISCRAPGLQWLHLTGVSDAEKVRQAYAGQKLKAAVHPFLGEMELALGAATVAVSRAGASSLAELAAMRVPAVLIPFPAATDNHQFYNARAFDQAGAARLLEQKNATPETLAQLLLDLLENAASRAQMQTALSRWHAPDAAERIAENILRTIESCKVVDESGENARPRAQGSASQRNHVVEPNQNSIAA
jgi:UDP-N-acetylglucosamine--N-acetylmuramyl-(pentapeptide) pyrophosphoryl-undecaprenol N-acetylglucosamine transferase